MASHSFYNKQSALVPGMVFIAGEIFVDSSGTVLNTGSTSTAPIDGYTGRAQLYPAGVESVVHLGSGVYRVTLRQPYYQLLHVGATVHRAQAAAGDIKLRQDNVSGADAGGITARTIDLEHTVSGSLVVLNGGSVGGFSLLIVLKNSNA